MKVKLIIFLAVSGIFICSGVNMRCINGKQTDKGSPVLKKIAVIDLPGKAGKRFDYLTIDYRHHYLLSAHLGADVTYVIDMNTDKLVKMIGDTPGAEGIEYAADLNKVYTSNWTGHTIGVIDMNKMEVVKKIPAINKPDGNTYAAPFKKLYVSDERGKTLLVVDTRSDEVIKRIEFKSETGMPQYDSVSRKVYLNLQDDNLFVVIDPQTDSIIGRYPVGECKGNHGMALDEEHHLAFLDCENNDLLTVFNLDSHAPVAYLKLASGGDVVKYDPGLKRVYVACYSGAISVFHEDDPAHFTKLPDFPVQKKVHSLAVDKITHRVYAPEQEEDGKEVSRMVVYDAL
ncbi:MAG TPA: YncE family protein [Bacteroidia bacterium]|jgi:DNA-binding beta-propeller fold protein YncE|nr:YncE family protein [Bacteroidia bacterium]